MDISKFKLVLSDNIIALMTDYMKDCGDDCEFSQKDIRKCEKILTQYLDDLAALSAPSEKEIMKCVKKAVLALNKLNEKTDYALLETEERETICELIQAAAIECGLTDPDDDITEEWREW